MTRRTSKPCNFVFVLFSHGQQCWCASAHLFKYFDRKCKKYFWFFRAICGQTWLLSGKKSTFKNAVTASKSPTDLRLLQNILTPVHKSKFVVQICTICFRSELPMVIYGSLKVKMVIRIEANDAFIDIPSSGLRRQKDCRLIGLRFVRLLFKRW